jgi:hypothetical protein
MHELYLWPFADAVRAGTGSSKCLSLVLNLFANQACSHVLVPTNQQLLWLC